MEPSIPRIGDATAARVHDKAPIVASVRPEVNGTEYGRFGMPPNADVWICKEETRVPFPPRDNRRRPAWCRACVRFTVSGGMLPRAKL